MNFVLKKIPEDFRVQETQSHHRIDDFEHRHYQCFRVTKKNYETFDVIDAISQHFGLSKSYIHFAGLKDKDGVTTQYISVANPSRNNLDPSSFNYTYYDTDKSEKYIHLSHIGRSDKKIEIADLFGNTFDIVVRAINTELKEKLINKSTFNFMFINYYDTQRFGIPHGKKIAHLIGHALEKSDYELATELINQLGDSPELIEHPLQSSNELFSRIDPRKLAFYRSAYSSWLWNKDVQQVLTLLPEDVLITEQSDGISFLYPKNVKDVLPILLDHSGYKYKRYIAHENEFRAREVERPVLVQVFIRCDDLEEDELHPGHFKCRFQFFLPSGCYATMVLKQLLYSL
ncbi:tRNA pseudouridine(13) synthase TruD [Pseudoalteromonas sp. S16_S37]|uniref:tRNA pseudouridine(13) synthase TruD n=1 Tax=Pseudoalteromonas sp. S16_S37 TaxID=2720228 RepID=UPI001680194B|nr:tRNA pseudouridine(13) synthase TruD [Pseudoalteromonas sp. S16_S37]MBD1583325.1 tRNA pseudouridine(13) synthase TruD [Pseudoalteromonas sp. S16_S37]